MKACKINNSIQFKQVWSKQVDKWLKLRHNSDGNILVTNCLKFKTEWVHVTKAHFKKLLYLVNNELLLEEFGKPEQLTSIKLRKAEQFFP